MGAEHILALTTLVAAIVGSTVGGVGGYLAWRTKLNDMEKKLDQSRQEMREDFSNIRTQLEAVARKEELAEVRSQIESVRRDDLTELRNDLTRQLENLRKDNLAGVKEELRKLSDEFQDLDKQTSDRLLAEIRHVIEPLVRDRAAQADAPKTKEASAGGAQVEGSTAKA